MDKIRFLEPLEPLLFYPEKSRTLKCPDPQTRRVVHFISVEDSVTGEKLVLQASKELAEQIRKRSPPGAKLILKR